MKKYYSRFYHYVPTYVYNILRLFLKKKDSPTQTGGGAMAAGRGESPEPDVLALILSPSSSDEEPD